VSASAKGGDLFIVDNSISGWTGLRYLAEWCEIAESFDIASGYFEIGSLLELDGLPVPVLRIGRKLRIPTAPLADVLGLRLDQVIELASLKRRPNVQR
jgi:hypothetical protein